MLNQMFLENLRFDYSYPNQKHFLKLSEFDTLLHYTVWAIRYNNSMIIKICRNTNEKIKMKNSLKIIRSQYRENLFSNVNH